MQLPPQKYPREPGTLPDGPGTGAGGNISGALSPELSGMPGRESVKPWEKNRAYGAHRKL